MDITAGELEESAHTPTAKTEQHHRKVLLAEFDLYNGVGGGQTSYRRLIDLCPWNSYYYFIEQESPEAPRPKNAIPIPLKYRYRADPDGVPDDMVQFYWDYLLCWQMAHSVREALGPGSFDVVDSPDYRTFAGFMRGALCAHGIDVGVVALALHGTISSALSDQWPNTRAGPRVRAELRRREHLQFRSVDVRYALSPSYASEWQRATKLESRMISPLHIVGIQAPTMAESDGPPEIVVVGRRERRKGPDLALDFVWAAGPPEASRLRFIGSDVPGPDGRGADGILGAMARLRKLDIAFEPSMSHEQLDALFRSRALVLLPSRYDQFNLVALEALRLGCPVIVSDRAGVAPWIRENLPELSDLVVDIGCSRVAGGRIRDILNDYDGARARVVEAVRSLAERPAEGDISRIYEPIGQADIPARATLSDLQSRFDEFNRPVPRSESEPGVLATRVLSAAAKAQIREVRDSVRRYSEWRPLSRQSIKRHLSRFALRTGMVHQESIPSFAYFPRAYAIRNALIEMPERTTAEITAKLQRISADLAGARVGRVQVFREMARLERKRGGDLVAATYCLRIMRWLGRNAYGDLDFVAATLQEHGLAREAEVARAMYGDPALSRMRGRLILDAAYEANLEKKITPAAIVEDRRPEREPVVSVIVSLYNAESKLPTLLDNLNLQTINSAGRMEVVLVDSASPSGERAVFEDYARRGCFPIVYTRSVERETIQGAWNRGIKLARGRYLSFLGADEGLHPRCFEELAGHLDARQDVDWVMADSVVTNVDRDGVFAGDVMAYDRTGYTWQHVFLETCYLSWVGGLYRRSIHERFGYYDESFRGAGDTEFKGRVLSRINTLHVPKMLGVFNNYPEERTTQSPRAELEDLRAWYLHRSPAGVAYSFDRHPVEAAEALFRNALTYRKSFCGHLSCDADLALAVAIYLEQRGENPQFAAKARRSADRLVRDTESLERLDFRMNLRLRQLEALRLYRGLRRREIEDQATFGLAGRPHYRIFNDNRHEQHWWSWSV